MDNPGFQALFGLNKKVCFMANFFRPPSKMPSCTPMPLLFGKSPIWRLCYFTPLLFSAVVPNLFYAFPPLLIFELFIPPLWIFHSSSIRVRRLILTAMIFIEDNNLIQRGPTTFDLQASSQKYDNSRPTSNKMMYKTTDSTYLKLKGKLNAWLNLLYNGT